MLRPSLLSCASAICLQGLGQTASLTNASLTVLAGTHVRLAAPLTWVIDADAAVVNDGLIDLGSEAVLQEADGAPIIGTGKETATWAPASPLADAEPGGLGLTLTTAYAGGLLSVERGHVPRIAPSGAEGIARWYRVITPSPTAEPLAAVLRYDLTELNEANASDLALFTAASADGPWAPVPSVSDAPAQTVSGSAGAPEVFVTAFDADGTTGLAQPHQQGWSLWPSLADGWICVSPPEGIAVHAIILRDSHGRIARQQTGSGAQGTLRIEVADLAPGAYLVSLNEGAAGLRFVKR